MKYLVNIIAIIVIALLIWGAIEFKKSNTYYSFQRGLSNFSQRVKNFINVKKHNIGMDISPPRKVPLTFIDKEAALQEYLPEVFQKFDAQEWKEFWALIYTPIEEKQGRFTVKRYRTREEVESVLKDRYPNPLAYFRENYWYELWSIADVSWER